MSIFNESSSSSDDDHILEALKEARDSQFLKDTLFHAKDESENNEDVEKLALPKSLRRNVEFMEESNEFGVTQNFKNFVAKQLAKSLDKHIQEINHKSDTESDRTKKRENPSAGIKLLSNSKVNLNDVEINEENNIEHNKRRRKELKRLENSAASISKCKEVAVKPDWILSKASTAVWTDRSKGTVYKYRKSNDGALVEIN